MFYYKVDVNWTLVAFWARKATLITLLGNCINVREIKHVFIIKYQ